MEILYATADILDIFKDKKRGGGDRDSEKWYNCLTVNQI